MVPEESDQFEDVGPGSDSSRKILMSYLPELYRDITSDDGILMGDLTHFEKNSFSICDIDSDGEAELLVKITTGSSAVNCQYIYKADRSGDVVSEGVVSNSSTFYRNGYVKSPLSHNQGYGEIWPYILVRYNKSEDEYVKINSLVSWDESVNPDNFTDDIDVSSTGVIYHINDMFSGEGTTCDYSDYVKWFNSWNQCSPRLRVNYEAFTEDNIRKYNPDWNG